MEEAIMRLFVDTDEFRYYVKDGEVSCYCISVVVLGWGTVAGGIFCLQVLPLVLVVYVGNVLF